MNFAYQGRHPPAKLAAIASTNMSNAINAPASNQSCWISNTGATDHFTPDITHIPDCHAYTGNNCVIVGNGQSLPITHTGNSQLHASSHLFHLRKVLHVPSMSSSLLSVAKIMMLLFILMHLSSKSRIYVRGNFFTVATVNVDSILSVVPFSHHHLLHPMPFQVLLLLNYGTLGLDIHSLESLVVF